MQHAAPRGAHCLCEFLPTPAEFITGFSLCPSAPVTRPGLFFQLLIPLLPYSQPCAPGSLEVPGSWACWCLPTLPFSAPCSWGSCPLTPRDSHFRRTLPLSWYLQPLSLRFPLWYMMWGENSTYLIESWWTTNEHISRGPNTKTHAQILPAIMNKNDVTMYISPPPIQMITPHGQRRSRMLGRTWWRGSCRTVSSRKFNQDHCSLWRKMTRETLISSSWFLQA